LAVGQTALLGESGAGILSVALMRKINNFAAEEAAKECSRVQKVVAKKTRAHHARQAKAAVVAAKTKAEQADKALKAAKETTAKAGAKKPTSTEASIEATEDAVEVATWQELKAHCPNTPQQPLPAWPCQEGLYLVDTVKYNLPSSSIKATS